MEKPERKKKFLIAALICFGLALILLVPALVLASSGFMIGVIAFGGVGVILLIIYFFENWAKLIIAVFFSTSFVLLWVLGEVVRYSQISTLFYLMAVLFPIIGIILGIVALSSGAEDKKYRKVRLGLSIFAIALPILIVIVLIILLSTGVLVITLM